MSASESKGIGQRKHVVLALLLLVVLALIAANLTWFSVTVQSVLGADIDVAASGQDMSPGITAAGLVAVASAVFLTIAGKVGKYVALATTLLAGALMFVASLLVIQAPRTSLSPIFAEATGADSVPDVVVQSVWPIVTVASAVLVMVVAVVGMLNSHRWQAKGSKYERSTPVAEQEPQNVAHGRPAGENMTDERQMWDSLSEGIDPSDR